MKVSTVDSQKIKELMDADTLGVFWDGDGILDSRSTEYHIGRLEQIVAKGYVSKDKEVYYVKFVDETFTEYDNYKPLDVSIEESVTVFHGDKIPD